MNASSSPATARSIRSLSSDWKRTGSRLDRSRNEIGQSLDDSMLESMQEAVVGPVEKLLALLRAEMFLHREKMLQRNFFESTLGLVQLQTGTLDLGGILGVVPDGRRQLHSSCLDRLPTTDGFLFESLLDRQQKNFLL